MRISIIGCGYVGSALAAKLKKNGHYITVTTRSSEKIPSLLKISDEVQILEGNQSEVWMDLLPKQDAVILTLAADSSETYESTYLETVKTLSKALEKNHSPLQIIYTGSTSVYGDHHGQKVDEQTPLSASSTQAHILISTEEVLLNLTSKERQVCIFRLGEIFGPERNIVDRIRQMNGRTLPGNGNSITNLIHLEDILNAINLALTKRLSGIYNLCCDIHLPRKKFYEEICKKENLPEVNWDSTKTSFHSGNKLVSNAKIKSIGFHFLQNSIV